MTFDFDDAAPRSWADAFPWLAGSPGAALVPWSNESIDGTHPEARRLRLAAISDLAIQRLARWTISQVFPGLPPDVNLLLLDLPTRALNVLRRFDCSTSVQIMPLTIEEMMDWRNAGVSTIDIILQRLAGLSTSLATPTVTAHPGLVVPRLESPNLPYQVLPDRIASVAGDLRVIATWDALVGQPGQTLLSDARRAGTPRRVLEAHRRLVSLTSAEVLHEAELGLNAADRLNDALGILEPRAIEVLAARFFADSPETLEQLGQAFGVTRERVRQIEGKARGSLLGVISEPGPLADLAQSVRDLISTIRPLDDLVESMPALAQDVQRVGQPAWRVLDRLDDAYEVEDGWCMAPTMTSALHLTQTQLQERADQYGVVRLDEIDLIESNNPERLRDYTAAWLRYCGYIVDGDFAMLRTSSVGDYAAAVLSIEGSPLSAQEIVDRFAFERTVGSTRNAMSTDERFDRVDRDRWALKEWGLETYGGIRSVIRELVAHSGGRARLDHVIEHITERYSVSSSSVAAYAAAPPFMTKDGIVQLDSGDRAALKAPENTRRIFRRSDGWAYRIRVTADHLRGSGSVAPMAIAAILDLHPGETVQLESPLGPQAVAWTGIQPSFGTIRRFLMDDDVPAGTDGFLVLNEDGTFGFERARDMVGDPLVDALALAGLPADTRREEARLAFARAIKLPEDSPAASIIGGYRSRGDEDIADLLLGARHYLEAGEEPPATAPDADIDAIMGLL